MTEGQRSHIRDKIAQIEYAANDAREALADNYYAACFPREYDEIPGFIQECKRQVRQLKLELYGKRVF